MHTVLSCWYKSDFAVILLEICNRKSSRQASFWLDSYVSQDHSIPIIAWHRDRWSNHTDFRQFFKLAAENVCVSCKKSHVALNILSGASNSLSLTNDAVLDVQIIFLFLFQLKDVLQTQVHISYMCILS